MTSHTANPKARARSLAGTLALLAILASSLFPLLTIGPARADTPLTNIAAGTNPIYIGADAKNNKVYVSNTNGAGTVTVIDGSTNTVATTLKVGSWPRGVAVNPTTNRIYVGNQISDTVSVIDGSTNKVIKTIDNVGNPFGLAVNVKTNMVYAVDNPSSLVVINGATDSVVGSVALPPRQGSFDVAVNPVTNMVYVTSANYYCALRCGPVGLVDVINGTTNT